ncbi:MAG: DUF2786 domain-containing protein [Deltaproteobacteria bacterium]|jgi:hypothetical protein|nr:DUF2786 domain-containing protein [Deltaproteobacteria bacterium]
MNSEERTEQKEILTSQVKSQIAHRLRLEHKWLLTKADYWPLQRAVVIDIFDGSSRWGWLDPRHRRIGLSEALILNHPWNVVLGVLGHETAHQMVSDFYPAYAQTDTDHGQAFERCCEKLRLDPVYRRASVDFLESGPPPSIFNRMDPDLPGHPVLEKVRKLLALSSSPETHEAEQALAMASRLMARHNIDAWQLEGVQKDCPYERWRIPLNTTRLASRDLAISSILQSHFFVKVVFTWEYDRVALRHLRQLELLGRPVNLHMARHVYYFLKERSETLWLANKDALAKKGEKGIGAKNAFISQMLDTFSDKLDKSEKQPFQGQVMPSNEVILAKDAKLREFVDKAFDRLGTFRSSAGSYSPASAAAGARAGAELSIYAPVAGGDGSGSGGGGGYIDYDGGR